ncbi:16S rRNA (cytidine(1402)-2'-O)-methyltransferase [Candidatus Roizmanbacteria bacterium RIFCSPHIGHO2_02_FULL_40_13b]|uniref:16S rRNA (Cytidine(1402)-2'-O)-methyltransferase n=1 Tax=Candidatus Roizmanbacteria bacterium RIFCSPHIGHO2_01_FULL_39_24 TaxID=1802032 RepID=A0A1F7GEZ4_9BACT|nr:MAG: 16S rRNA (cytidine(1402)-2'-O)-methyltransferase [Candidatus Roizmanbacteria bacterium RIFCSPHIGHO2_01_FULL_39_24]OGK26739.1 MAG: 16S rRNA (cytidine(1402)-2'-O)-methyltransferase [Candidatus Roizmanbacteria bacterium RIFCSPHIGHO2_02_FULL_40_13b]OGK48965.1 MAG: 16S rRNA (cytidine(1402)-2'-O)-methyltransferase [Candidatus Roizmanbacteria bacterium RIFCSPLOWO2_01_FULL_40_32]OGK56303.1 MAG: 16S rRNA (cytidine(1402)-2'-O)-methyltransferase [Candidatus Roizmanbacteria bacterium RIFCSPLOWO2_02_
MLFIIGTSIGNIEDTTLRAVRTLCSAEIILAEDTRTFGTYYKRVKELFKLSSKKQQKFLSFHTENEFEQLSQALELLKAGLDVVLVSESGMPVISDPGALLLSHVIKEGIPYTVIPGPSALTTAAVLSGFKTERLLFLGFLPKKESQIISLLKNLKDGAVIFYESPHRINKTLEILAKELPNTKIAICREMTKKFEEVVRGTPGELSGKTYKGELTVVIRL